MIDFARQQVTLFTKNSQVVYQVNQHAIRPSLILRSFIGGRRRLETYGSLSSIECEVETGTYYPSLHVVEEFLDVFPNRLSGLPLDREIKFCIDLIIVSQPIFIPPYRMALT